MIIRQILGKKGSDVWAVHPDDTVFTALQLMADKNVGALLVMDGDELKGIFSERDYARKVVLLDKSSKNTPVREIMTPRVFYVSPNHTSDDCMALMTDKRIRHLPILEDGRVIGVISIGDVVKAVISEQQMMIHDLESYITTGTL